VVRLKFLPTRVILGSSSVVQAAISAVTRIVTVKTSVGKMALPMKIVTFTLPTPVDSVRPKIMAIMLETTVEAD